MCILVFENTLHLDGFANEVFVVADVTEFAEFSILRKRNDNAVGDVLSVGSCTDNKAVVHSGFDAPLDIGVGFYFIHAGSNSTNDVACHPACDVLTLEFLSALDSVGVGHHTFGSLESDNIFGRAEEDLPSVVVVAEDTDNGAFTLGEEFGAESSIVAVAHNDSVARSILEVARSGCTFFGIALTCFNPLNIVETHQLALHHANFGWSSGKFADRNRDSVDFAHIGKSVELCVAFKEFESHETCFGAAGALVGVSELDKVGIFAHIHSVEVDNHFLTYTIGCVERVGIDRDSESGSLVLDNEALVDVAGGIATDYAA